MSVSVVEVPTILTVTTDDGPVTTVLERSVLTVTAPGPQGQPGPEGPQGPPGDADDALTEEQAQLLIDAALGTHIDAAEPHPAYDDIQSLRLVFENGLI